MHSTKASEEVMQATNDPYAGITLPEPPSGYRLAKWGEERVNLGTKVLFWSRNGRWVNWSDDLTALFYDPDNPSYSIFAIPLDQPSPLKSWQFREVPWVVPEPKTLADVPEGVACVCQVDECLVIVQHSGGEAYSVNPERKYAGKWYRPVDLFPFVRYLDPPLQKPLSINDVPDGRVVQMGEDSPVSFPVLFWRAGNTWWVSDVRTGEIKPAYPPCEKWEVTNYIAEFREAT